MSGRLHYDKKSTDLLTRKKMRTSSYKVGNGHNHQSEADDAYAEDDDGTEGRATMWYSPISRRTSIQDQNRRRLPSMKKFSVPRHNNNSNEEVDEEEVENNRMHIEVGAPERKGEGLNAHVVFGIFVLDDLAETCQKIWFSSTTIFHSLVSCSTL